MRNGKNMNDKYPNPWDFSNNDKNLKSPNGFYKVEYGKLNEIAMGAPIGGECFLINNEKRIKLSDWCGGPIIWNNSSTKIALPTGTKNRNQKIVIVDIEMMTATTYKKEFSVLNLQSFEGNLIKGIDSPIHMPTVLNFDLEKEKIEKKVQLK